MSALAEALVAAQRRALSATEKAYVAGFITHDDAVAELNAFGLTDQVDIDFLLAALDVVRLRGAALPAEPNNGAADSAPVLASDKQKGYIVKLLHERGHPVLAAQDVAKLTKERASQMIEALQAGTYDPAEWDVPF